jgi:outer membrane protein assembly factor BamA
MAVTEKSDELSLLVEVREGKPGNVAFGPGWNLVGGWLYSSETSYTNLGGVGRRLSLKGSISEEKHQPAIGPRTLLGRSASAGYLEPYIFGSPINSGISVRHRAEAFNEYWKLSNEGEINFSYKLRSFLAGSTVTTFYGQEISRIEGTLNSEENLATPNLIRVGKVGLRYAIDETNSKEFPTEGFIFNMEYAHAAYPLGGNLRFERIDFTNSHFFGITDRWVFAVGLGVTSYSNIATESVDLPDVLPSSERLQLGGTTAAVRGYRPLRIGPAARVPTLEDGEWDCGHKFVDIGGSRRTVLKTELRYKITDFVATTGFIDSGTTFFSDEQVGELEKAFSDAEVGSDSSDCPGERTNRRLLENVGYEYEELIRNPGYFWSRHYLSYGSAVNFLTPIGSLNLAYGLPWKQPETANCQDEGLCYDHGLNKERHWILRGNLHISLGAQF